MPRPRHLERGIQNIVQMRSACQGVASRAENIALYRPTLPILFNQHLVSEHRRLHLASHPCTVTHYPPPTG